MHYKFISDENDKKIQYFKEYKKIETKTKANEVYN